MTFFCGLSDLDTLGKKSLQLFAGVLIESLVNVLKKGWVFGWSCRGIVYEFSFRDNVDEMIDNSLINSGCI